MENYSMTEDIALDFTEQLMIFETCGNVFARSEFIQAVDVSVMLLDSRSKVEFEYGN